MSSFFHFVAELVRFRVAAILLASGFSLSATSAFADCLPTLGPIVTCSGVTDNPGGDGFGTGNEDNFSITVQKGASVTGGTFDGFFLGFDNTVTNHGTITGTNGFGINGQGNLFVYNYGTIRGFDDDGIIANDVFVANASSGVIYGKDNGITGDNVLVFNSGTITGGSIGIEAVSDLAYILNYGSISGSMQPGGYGVFAPRVNITNFGTISGYTGIGLTGLPSPGSVLVNSGTIRGVFASIDFSFGSGGDTLTFLPGSRLIGSVELGNANAPSTVNIVTGRDIGWLITFGACGCGGLVENQSIVNFFGKAPYVVSGNQIATLDATAFGLSDRTLMDFTGSVSSLVGGRSGELGAPAGAGATGFAAASSPIVDVANAAFASAMPVSAYASEGRGPGVLPSATSVDRASGTAMWSKAFGGIRKQDGDDVFLASRSTIYGAAVGLDGQLRPDLRIGLFFGAGYGKFDVDKSSQTIETDYVFGGVYGRHDWNAHFLDFALTGGRSSNDNTRLVANNLAPDGLETAKSKYDGWFFSPELAYGIRIPIAPDMVLTPTARVRYLTGRFDGYAETGSAQNLVVAGRNLQDIEERFELALARFDPFVSGVLKTTVTLGAVGLQRVGDKTINTNLIGQNLAFITPGDDASYGGYLGLGFDYRANQRINLFAGVEGTLMNDKSRTGTAKGGARIAF